MAQKRGSIQRKVVISLIVVGLFSGLVVLFFVYLTETTTLLLLSPMAIVILALFSYLAAQRIVKPIRVLNEWVDQIGQGDFRYGLKIKTGDEIEKLADTFSHMAQDLEKRFEEIKLERDKLNTVMDSIGDGLVILDRDCNIQQMNAKFIESYGKESIGRPCREVLGIVDTPCKECSVEKEQDFKPHSLEVVTDKGITYLITHSRIKNLDGSISIVEIFKDISQRKRLAQQLLHSERLAALSQFSSTFAHDLRNPIIAIKKTIEMLKDSYSLPPNEAIKNETIKRVYTDLISTCGLLLGLVNDMLDIHQVSYRDLPLLFSSFSLRQALEEVIKLLRIEAEEKKIHIEIGSNDRDVWIDGDKRRIQRVFINLLSNAIRYSPLSGKIWMSFQVSTPPDSSPDSMGAPTLLFKIEDEGPGIAPFDLSKVFDLFYKKDRGGIKSGTGLGLYFCKVVVEAHGGKVRAENRERGGAAFYIEMPLVRRELDAYQDSYSR